MSKLCIALAPFSPDYSGAASVFFDFNALTVMHDASGCTGNYTSYDEPRWYGSKQATYCSGLRELDAVLGDDEKLIHRTLAAVDSIQPEAIAVLGSPVPMVIGADLPGIATEIETRSGIPAFGFNTTGLNFYNKGISQALMALAKRWMAGDAQTIPNSVNILGMTVIDYGHEENGHELRQHLEHNGWRVISSLSMGGTLSSIAQAPQAAVNLVVAQAGMDLAEWMERNFAIPYVAMTPLGSESKVSDALREAIREQKSRIVQVETSGAEGGVLLIGEQMMSNSLRYELAAHYGVKNITVGCLFGLDERLSQPHDLDLSDEQTIRRVINDERYRVIVGDQMFQQLQADKSRAVFLDFPQVAVSSKLHWKEIPHYLSSEMNALLAAITKEIQK